MKCVFCGEQDASKLAIIVKAVEGRIIYDREACLDCLWKSRFAVKTLEENGKILSETGLSEELRKRQSEISKA